jgi:hypothetical protein
MSTRIGNTDDELSSSARQRNDLAGFVGLAPNIFHPVPPNATAQEMNKALANRTDADYLADMADQLKSQGTPVELFCTKELITGFWPTRESRSPPQIECPWASVTPASVWCAF